jgi:benzoyl-CoA reductase/2-hydroxyglutaryl-CoA dehydratase subunit BcrC/BadD/HgdB
MEILIMARFGWFSIGFIPVMLLGFFLNPNERIVNQYIYDDEARLVGFCNGKYLIRTEEDEFPKTGCMFIEPITWKDEG